MRHKAWEIHLNPNEHPPPPTPQHTYMHCICTFPKEKAEGLYTFSSCRVHSLSCTCSHTHTHTWTKERKGSNGLSTAAQQRFMCVIILSWYCPNPPLIHYPSGKMKLGLPFYLSPLPKHLFFWHVCVWCVCIMKWCSIPWNASDHYALSFFSADPSALVFLLLLWLCVFEFPLLMLWGYKSM